MALGLKNFVVALAALLFGVGHAACACPQSSAAAAVIAESQHGSGHHGHAASDKAQHADHTGGGESAPCDPSHNSCEHCQAAQFASAPDAAKLAVPQTAPGVFIAILNAPFTAIGKSPILKATARLHWAAPPGPSPVSLKIRLLN